jgi:recombinational DNA repair protein (RecF pathway)
VSKAHDLVIKELEGMIAKLVDNMPPREPIHPRAYEFVNTYNEYLEETNDDGDMLLIMVDRLIREFEKSGSQCTSTSIAT